MSAIFGGGQKSFGVSRRQTVQTRKTVLTLMDLILVDNPYQLDDHYCFGGGQRSLEVIRGQNIANFLTHNMSKEETFSSYHTLYVSAKVIPGLQR